MKKIITLYKNGKKKQFYILKIITKLINIFGFNLFGKLYKSDNKFKELWDATPKISSDGPHYIQHHGLLNQLSNKVKNHIKKVKTPIYKLSYKYNMEKYNKKSNIVYTYNFKKFKGKKYK